MRSSMAWRMGLYRKRFINHTRMRKLSACAPTVNQSISTAYFPAAWAITSQARIVSASVVHGRVTKKIKGGLLVDIGDHHASALARE